MTIHTTNAAALLDVDALLCVELVAMGLSFSLVLCTRYRKVKEKGYVQLQTNKGDLNFEVSQLRRVFCFVKHFQ